MLERLRPIERAAFLLHEVCDASHDEIAVMLGRSAAACRQLVSRARRRLGGPLPRASANGAGSERAEQFLLAFRTRDVAGLVRHLAPEVTLTSDGGGKVVSATRVIRGAERVARFLGGLLRKLRPNLRAVNAGINARPGLILTYGDAVFGTLALDLDADGTRVSRSTSCATPTSCGM